MQARVGVTFYLHPQPLKGASRVTGSRYTKKIAQSNSALHYLYRAVSGTRTPSGARCSGDTFENQNPFIPATLSIKPLTQLIDEQADRLVFEERGGELVLTHIYKKNEQQ